MKRKTRIILLSVAAAIALCVTAGAVIVQGIQKNLAALARMPIEDIPPAKVKDGVYVGEYTVFPVSARVEVTVKDSRIASARIMKHQNGQGGAGEKAVSQAVEQNTLLVDTVAGATYSSKVLLKAMENALRQGLAP